MTEPTREEVFAFIESKGGDSAVIDYSGGHDEGGINSIGIYKDDNLVCELEEPRERWNPETKTYELVGDKGEEKFIKAIIQPVYEEYHSFAGEFYVDGTLTWDCKEKKVTNSGEEEIPVSNSFEKEI